MSKEGQNGQSEEELYNRVAKALREGDDAEVNKLMAEPDDNAPEEDKNSEPAQPVNDEPEAPESASQPPEAPEPDEPTPEDPLEGLDEKAREYVRSLKEERDISTGKLSLSLAEFRIYREKTLKSSVRLRSLSATCESRHQLPTRKRCPLLSRERLLKSLPSYER